MIGFVKSLFKRKNWNEFCKWLNEYLEVEPSKLPITWTKILTQSGRLVRLDFAPGKPYQVITAIEDKSEMCDRDHAYMMANRVRYLLENAIKKTPKTALWAHWG